MFSGFQKFIKRRTYLINRDLQVALLIRAVVGAVALFVVVGTALVLPFVMALQTIDPSSAAQEASAALLLRIHAGLVPVASLTLLAAVLSSLRTSHRIAGPLLQITRALGRVHAGILPEMVRTRDRDLLGAETEAVRETIHSLRERVSEIQAANADVQAAISGMGDKRLAEVARRLDAAANQFTVEGETMSSEAEIAAPRAPTVIETTESTTRGFTLIELMVVIAIIGVIATIAVPKYVQAVRNARNIQAIGDIKQIQVEIEQYRLTNGGIPPVLQNEWIDPWGRPYQYTPWASIVDVIDGEPVFVDPPAEVTKKGKTKKGKTKKGKKGKNADPDVPIDDADPPALDPETELINREYDLYSFGADGEAGDTLAHEDSEDDIIRADDGGFIGLARTYSSMNSG